MNMNVGIYGKPKCDYCLIKTLNRECCPLCDNNKAFFCEYCMNLHLIKHETLTENPQDFKDLHRESELSTQNNSGLF